MERKPSGASFFSLNSHSLTLLFFSRRFFLSPQFLSGCNPVDISREHGAFLDVGDAVSLRSALPAPARHRRAHRHQQRLSTERNFSIPFKPQPSLIIPNPRFLYAFPRQLSHNPRFPALNPPINYYPKSSLEKENGFFYLKLLRGSQCRILRKPQTM